MKYIHNVIPIKKIPFFMKDLHRQGEWQCIERVTAEDIEHLAERKQQAACPGDPNVCPSRGRSVDVYARKVTADGKLFTVRDGRLVMLACQCGKPLKRQLAPFHAMAGRGERKGTENDRFDHGAIMAQGESGAVLFEAIRDTVTGEIHASVGDRVLNFKAVGTERRCEDGHTHQNVDLTGEKLIN